MCAKCHACITKCTIKLLSIRTISIEGSHCARIPSSTKSKCFVSYMTRLDTLRISQASSYLWWQSSSVVNLHGNLVIIRIQEFWQEEDHVSFAIFHLAIIMLGIAARSHTSGSYIHHCCSFVQYWMVSHVTSFDRINVHESVNDLHACVHQHYISSSF